MEWFAMFGMANLVDASSFGSICRMVFEYRFSVLFFHFFPGVASIAMPEGDFSSLIVSIAPESVGEIFGGP
jgi:hypothetical protein